MAQNKLRLRGCFWETQKIRTKIFQSDFGKNLTNFRSKQNCSTFRVHIGVQLNRSFQSKLPKNILKQLSIERIFNQTDSHPSNFRLEL